jgi:hypothetical protein
MPPTATVISTLDLVEIKSSASSNDIEKDIQSTTSSETPVYEVDHYYLMRFCLFLSFASSIQAGIAMCENGQVGYVLMEKLGWSKRDYTICTLLGPAGIAVGSMVAC